MCVCLASQPGGLKTGQPPEGLCLASPRGLASSQHGKPQDRPSYMVTWGPKVDVPRNTADVALPFLPRGVPFCGILLVISESQIHQDSKREKAPT